MEIEPSDNPNEDTIKDHKKLCQVLEVDQICSLFLTLCGCSSLVLDHLVKNCNILEAPVQVRFGLVQCLYVSNVVYLILSGNEEFLETSHLPTAATKEDSWRTEEDFEARLIFVVREYYKDLKAKGKIT